MFSREVRVLIADDEKHARDRLKSLLSENSVFNVVCEVTSCNELVQKIEQHRPDVAFLDINMPGESVFKVIASVNIKPLIVFQTAYSDYGPDAFDINAADYLLKPISRERFYIAVDKILQKLAESNNETITVQSGEKLNILKISEIIRISFEDGFCFIYTDSQISYSDKSLSYFDEALNKYGFYRISRTDLINIKFIDKLVSHQNTNSFVELISGHTLNISRRRLNGLKKILTSQ